MRTIIFANGMFNNPLRLPALLRPDDILIAADGGARHCRALGLIPQVAIGDFDSLTEEELAELSTLGAKIIRHPQRKDYTDLELALDYALEQKPQEILIVGALGLRWDQTLANLLLPARCAAAKVRVCLLDGLQEIYLLVAGQTLVVNGQPGDTVSLIPIGGDAQGISTNGLEYPLKDETLYFGATRGVSNLLVNQKAQVTLRLGLLICVVIHQK